MPKIQITAKGIRAALKKYTPYQSVVEYIWNGFDAQASDISIEYKADELGNIEYITICDNGYGIPHSKLQEKFEPLFESKKALENKLKKNQSAIHGKNGIGRLTFFTFARNASWETTYCENDEKWTYEIYANAENINLYTGINAVPRSCREHTGTRITFTGIHGITAVHLEEKFQEFLLKEFAWFLALNVNRNFSISLNGHRLDYTEQIADQEEMEIIHEQTQTVFNLKYIRWNQRPNNELSRYYYINSQYQERWKEPTAIKNKGEQFYHSIFVQSEYFDNFSFQSSQENQQPLIAGTRSDKQFKFLRKKMANILRIKHRPFLRGFAEQLLKEYEQKNIFPINIHENLYPVIQTLYEMQPKIFASLNTQQKKVLVGFLNILLGNKHASAVNLLESVIGLTESEKSELSIFFQI